MTKHSKNRHFDIFPGDFPVDVVSYTLGIELEAGPVKCAAPAIKHAQANHPEVVPFILPHLSQLVTNPLYMGDDHRNPDKIEFVGRIPGHEGAALVAISIVRNAKDGHYHVCSMYMISQSQVDKRRDKCILHIAKSK